MFDTSFPLTGILISCKRKRDLFLLLRTTNNPILKQYHKKYCNILVKVIHEAKRMTYSARVSASNNKTKTTWTILNELLGGKHFPNIIQKLTLDGTHLTVQQCIAEGLNKCFTSIVDVINSTKLPVSFHIQAHLNTFLQILEYFSQSVNVDSLDLCAYSVFELFDCRGCIFVQFAPQQAPKNEVGRH